MKGNPISPFLNSVETRDKKHFINFIHRLGPHIYAFPFVYFQQENTERDCTLECGPDKRCHLETCCIDRTSEAKLVEITTISDTAGVRQRHTGSTAIDSLSQLSESPSNKLMHTRRLFDNSEGPSSGNLIKPSSGDFIEPSSESSSPCNTNNVLPTGDSDSAINQTMPSGDNISAINTSVPPGGLNKTSINPSGNDQEIVTLSWGTGHAAIQPKPNNVISVISQPQMDNDYSTKV